MINSGGYMAKEQRTPSNITREVYNMVIICFLQDFLNLRPGSIIQMLDWFRYSKRKVRVGKNRSVCWKNPKTRKRIRNRINRFFKLGNRLNLDTIVKA